MLNNRMGFYEDLINGMKSCIGEGKKIATNADMARHCGVQAVQTSRYLNGEREKHLKALGNILDKIGAKLVWDHVPATNAPDTPESAQYEATIAELRKEIESLRIYKAKWEGHLEALRAQSGVDTQKLPEKNKLAS